MGSKASQREDADERFPHTDDFTRIPGIGPVIQEQLHEAGILSYAQLAALTTEQIAQLVVNLPLLSAERIADQNWPAHARALAAQPSLAEQESTRGVSAGQLRYATFTVELLLDHLSRVYRTRVVHLQDGDENSWAGWDQARMFDFFAEYAALDSAATAPGTTVEPAGEYTNLPEPSAARPSAAASPIAPAQPPHQRSAGTSGAGLWLEIGEMTLGEALPTGQPRESVDTTRAQARLEFRLNGARAAHAQADTLPFTAALLAYALAGEQVVVLATCRDRLSPNQIDHELSFAFDLPQEGRYQLIGTVVIADAGVVGSVLGPVLRVI